MSVSPNISLPLVSVIIPCYNHAKFLHNAFESIWIQDYNAIEIIVVDDGSSDNTRETVANAVGVNYVYQTNQGLSAARNTGVKYSKGEYVVFLDADDWLYPNAISTNVSYLQQHPSAAFVSGDYDYTINENIIVHKGFQEVNEDHYLSLLKSNYIGMIATVMFRKKVFNEFLYDTNLKNCEDYDLYLKIARKYPVLHHSNKIAVYRFHNTNMSNNIPFMLKGVLNVLENQKKYLTTERELKAYASGKKIWKKYYSTELYKTLHSKEIKPTKLDFLTLFRYQPLYLLKYYLKKRIFNV